MQNVYLNVFTPSMIKLGENAYFLTFKLKLILGKISFADRSYFREQCNYANQVCSRGNNIYSQTFNLLLRAY